MSHLVAHVVMQAAIGAGECAPVWSDRFHYADFEETVWALCSFPGPKGPRLFAGGFTHVNGEPGEDLAWWDGQQWHPLEAGTSGGVRTLAVFDEGGGDALYVGGFMNEADGVLINGIGRWRDGAWSAMAGGVGPSGTVYDIEAFDDGNGPSLYVGGFFVIEGDTARIARWDGAAWRQVGDEVLDDGVYDMTVFDDGSGPALWVCGRFDDFVLGPPAERVAKWNGKEWTGIVGGLTGTARAIAVFDDGSGDAIYVGGSLLLDGESAPLVRRTDEGWEAVGGFDAEIRTLLAFDDGSGSALYAGGLPVGGAAPSLARWDGEQWDDIDGGTNESVLALAAHDDGGEPELFACGTFSSAGGVPAARVAAWDGAAWAAPGTENTGNGVSTYVGVIAVHEIDDDVVGFDAPTLGIAGVFNLQGPDRVNGAATWDGRTWGRLADGVPTESQLSVLASFGEPPARHLYTGSRDLHRWDGNAWIAEELGLVGSINVLEELDVDGERALYAGGLILEIAGLETQGVAKFDGESWSALGGGADGRVWAFAVYDDGDGAALYVGGRFGEAGGVPARGIARWDGAAWTAVGGSTDGDVQALLVHDDGTGAALYAGGDFEHAGAAEARHLARWDGATWSAVGAGTDDEVWALETHDDGRGPAMYVGGEFAEAGGLAVNGVARWDGADWEALDTGLRGRVWALRSTADRVGPALYVGGSLFEAGGLESRGLARWGCAACRGDVDLDGIVGFDDLIVVLGSWGPCAGCEADLNADGRVTFDDLLIVLDAWGPCE